VIGGQIDHRFLFNNRGAIKSFSFVKSSSVVKLIRFFELLSYVSKTTLSEAKGGFGLIKESTVE